MIPEGRHPASFRDPSGFIFVGPDGEIYRQVNKRYASTFDRLTESGLFSELIGADQLVDHQEAPLTMARSEDAHRIIRPKPLRFISHPYEWPFSALKDAALLTLDIQSAALRKGFSLKDCSAYNVQFDGAHPLFIDTLSFDEYVEGEPWVAYRQFCQHFLAPLALMARRDIRMSVLLRDFIDGIPLDLAARLLPRSTLLRPGLALHLHLHSKAQRRYQDTAQADHKPRTGHLSKKALKTLVDSLRQTITGLTWEPRGTTWADYYDHTSYSSDAFTHKKELVGTALDELKPESVWDLGANVGTFARIADDRGIPTIALDMDPACVEMNYLAARKEGRNQLMSIVMDLANPSPSLGWMNRERNGLMARAPVDTALALALIHHLAISNNVSFDQLALFFHGVARRMVIEFVPIEDPQVQRLLASRENIFDTYHLVAFKEAMLQHFTLVREDPIHHSPRTLLVFERL